jgi:hypothetical protein
MPRTAGSNPNVVRALQSFVADIGGLASPVHKDDLFEVDHPLVKSHPEFFGPVLLRFPVDRGVEAATAAPGEKRGR